MLKTHNEKPLVTSKEAKKLLKVSDCHLAHLRMEGKLPFVKKGNAYIYKISALHIIKIYNRLTTNIHL